MAFSQQGPRTTCIISANGALCTATLRQPATSGGIVTYEVYSGSSVQSTGDAFILLLGLFLSNNTCLKLKLIYSLFFLHFWPDKTTKAFLLACFSWDAN